MNYSESGRIGLLETDGYGQRSETLLLNTHGLDGVCVANARRIGIGREPVPRSKVEHSKSAERHIVNIRGTGPLLPCRVRFPASLSLNPSQPRRQPQFTGGGVSESMQ